MNEDRTSGTIHPLETASPEELREHHAEVLKATVRLAFETIPFHRERLEAAGFEGPDDVRGLEDLAGIPITRMTAP